MQKVTGVGGVFFKARNPQQLMEWYDQHLGLQFQHGYIQFKWAEDQGSKTGSTSVAIFKVDSKYFNPGEKPYMINFRVSDLRALLTELREKGVTIDGDMQEFEYGRFGWIIDPEGNKIELWEPIESGD
jgi:predicted enzyme related to lactoylglutathione lyase